MNDNILIFDPNRIDGTDSGYLQTETLNINVRLVAVRKQKSSIVVAEGMTTVTGRQGDTTDFIQGNKVSNDPNTFSLSTLYTEANSNFDTIENGTTKDLETLGIKDINIDFTSAYTPLITMELTDVRGRLFQNGNNSPYAVFYDMPYPIFELTVKGFVGKAVTYKLHLLKFASTFNSQTGGFDVKCEFVGYHYAMLSDMLIGYLKGVVHTNIGAEIKQSPKFSGATIDGLRGEIRELKDAVQSFTSDDTQVEAQLSSDAVNSINILTTKVSNTLTEFANKIKVAGVSSSDYGINTKLIYSSIDISQYIEDFHSNLELFVTEYNKTVSDDFKIPQYSENLNYYSEFNGSLIVKLINGSNAIDCSTIHNKKLPENTIIASDFPIGELNIKTITVEFLLEEIQKVRNVAESKSSEFKYEAAKKFDQVVKNSDIKLDIGYYFSVLCNHVDILMKSIARVAKEAENSPERKSYFKNLDGLNNENNSEVEKITPFPEYKEVDPTQKNAFVERWIGRAQATDKILPEVQFVEELIRGIVKAYQEDRDDEKIIEASSYDEQVLFTPINPIELGLGVDYNPFRAVETMSNVDELIRFMIHRASMFLITQQYGLQLSDTVIKNLITIEIENMQPFLEKNEKLKSLFNTALTNGIDIEKYFKKISNTYKPLLLEDGYFSPYSNVSDYDTGQGWRVDFTREYVSGILAYYNENFVRFGGFQATNEGNNEAKQKLSVLRLGNTEINLSNDSGENEDENTTIVKSSSILDENTSASNDTVKDINFNKLTGSPFIKQFNGIPSHMNFYTKSKLTPDDLRVINDELDSSVFLSDIFRYQDNNRDKTLVFLFSVPFKYQESSIGNFSTDILRMFNQRSGVVRSSFLFTAMIGGILLYLDNKLNIKIVEDLYRPLVLTNAELIESKSVGVRKYINNSSRQLPLVKKYLERGNLSFANSDSDIIKADLFYDLFSDDMKKMFIGKFNELVSIMEQRIFPEVDKLIYNDKFNTLTKRFEIFRGYGGLTSYNGKGVTQKVLADYGKPFKENDIYETNSLVININKEFTPYELQHTFGLIDYVMKKGTNFYNTLESLINATVDIYNYNANFWYRNTVGHTTEKGTNALILGSNLETYLRLLDETVINMNAEAKAEELNRLSGEPTLMMNVFGSNNSEDIRLKVYKDIKGIYDKWICGEDRFNKTDDEYETLYDSFKFINRTYEDISSEFMINLFTTMKDLHQNNHQPLYGHISKVLASNNFLFLPSPNYANLGSKEDLVDMFQPRYYTETQPEVRHSFVCMYVGEYSTKLDLGQNNRFRSDGIELTNDGTGTYQISAQDFVAGTKSPIIVARYGDSNQSIFKNFELSQTEFSATNESLMITDDITKNNGLGQNLFDIYSLRSYTLKMTMLGNAMVQPFMYFYLEGVPMFYGLYLVTRVNHTISANTMETHVTAVRMRQTMTKMVDIESLYYNLFEMVRGGGTLSGGRNGGTGRYDANLKLKGQGVSFSTASPFAKFINYEIINSTGVVIGKAQEEKYALPETGEFIKEIGVKWAEYVAKNPSASPQITINGISLKYGGSLGVHKSHKIGTSIDLRPIRNDGTNNPVNYTDTNVYSREHTRNLIKIIKEIANSPKYKALYTGNKNAIYEIYFNDPQLISEFEEVRHIDGHNNHLHVEFRLPEKYLPYSTNYGWDGSANLDNTAFPEDYQIGDKIPFTSSNTFNSNPNSYEKFIGNISNDLNLAPEVKAFMEVISYGEGTMGRGVYNGYDILFNHYIINGYSTTTQKIRHRGKPKGNKATDGNWSQSFDGGTTGAAGRYQFMYGTWKEMMYKIQKENKRTSANSSSSDEFNFLFTKRNQDMACAMLMKVVLGDINKVINISNETEFRVICRSLASTWQCFDKVSTTGYNTWNNLYKIYTMALNKYN